MTESSSPRLALPLLAAGQAQKEMYHNEALIRLDLAAQACAVAAEIDDPPESPEAGETWIVGAAPTGAWTGHAHALAGWTAGGWRFVAPFEGLRVWIGESDGFALFSEGHWRIGVAHGRLIVEGEQVIGPRAGAIAEPDGGTLIDTEARTAIASILAAMRGHGLIEEADL